MSIVNGLGELLHGATSGGPHTTAVVRRARSVRRCASRAIPACTVRILPAALYAYTTAWPGHDANDGPRPWHMSMCEPCARHYAGNGRNPHLVGLLFAPPGSLAHGLSDPTGVTDGPEHVPDGEVGGFAAAAVGRAGYITCTGVQAP